MEDEEFYPRSARTPAMSQSTGSGLESRATSISSLENEEGGCNRKDILYSRGMKDLLRPLAKGITHSLEEKKNPKETRRARKAIDKLNPQYIATKMTRDRQPITDELTQVKELLREEQEKNRQNNERHEETFGDLRRTGKGFRRSRKNDGVDEEQKEATKNNSLLE